MNNYDTIVRELYDNEKILYHYTTIESFFNILNSNEIWLSRYDFLNDPLEFNYAESIVKNTIKNRNTFFKTIDWEELINYIRKSIEDSFIFSLSKKQDNLYLWSHYSKFKGLCIHLSVLEHLPLNEFCAKQKDVNGYEILQGSAIYNKEKQIEIVEKIFDDYESVFYKRGNIQSEARRIALINMLTFCFSAFKQEGLINEEEYRFVFKMNKKNNLKFRYDNNLIVPYIKIPLRIFKINGITLSPKLIDNRTIKSIDTFLKYKGINCDINESKIILR